MPVSDYQTRSFLMRRFEEAGIHPRTRYGQNFLIDQNLLRMLFDTAAVEPGDVVLEIGTGTGALTGMIARDAAAVVTVEVDAELYQLASEELFGADNVQMLHTDALKNKNTLSPDVLEAVRTEMAVPDRRFKLVSNLPYNIATPILSNLLACDVVPSSMTVTIQKEVADRIVAVPGNKDYGALSVWVQSQCQAELIRVMPPQAFWPRPKVFSAIVHITFDPGLRSRIVDLEFFHQFVRSLFFHRRKYLRSVLQSAFKRQLPKEVVDEVLAEQGIAPDLRAERLTIDEILPLGDAFRLRLEAKPAE